MGAYTIKDGMIYDGIQEKGCLGDIVIRDGVIETIGHNLEVIGKKIEARGMAVCPGFVDIHRHCDRRVLTEPDFGEAELLQGITTTVTGNCGMSVTPVNRENPKELNNLIEPVTGKTGELELYEFGEYMAALEQSALPLNMTSMIGLGSVRIYLKGFSALPFSKNELDQAASLVEEALYEGAPGASVGIMYLPEYYNTPEDYAHILRPVGKCNKVLTAHIRGEGDSLADSIAEIIDIGKRAGCSVEISHMKSCGVRNWRKEIFRAIDLIEKARGEGQDITCDFYPYEGGSTALTTMLPPDFVAGDMAAALKRLGTPSGIEAFRKASQEEYRDWDNYAVTLGWDRIRISAVTEACHEKYLGLSVTEAAKRYGFSDGAAFAAYMMHEEDGKTGIINMSMCREDIDTIAKLPYASVISDALYADTATPHPRLYGAFPKIIREYVMERKLYTMGEAIRRMTSMPAQRLRIRDRGVLKAGTAADINIFDPSVFRDNADFKNSARLATGLEYCFVNGEAAVCRGIWNRNKNGKLLRIQ